jgi:N-acetylated-alpha-linked acidic dipeptidase
VRALRSLLVLSIIAITSAALRTQSATAPVFGYRDFSAESKIEEQFLTIPDPKLAGQELKTISADPHLAATPEDYKLVQYIAQKFRAAGLETEIVPYRVLLNWPRKVQVTAWDAMGRKIMSGPTPEHADGDTAPDNPRVVMPFSGASASGDVTGEAVYGNYCRIDDYNQLTAQHIDLHGKIMLCRYGQNFRGIKVSLAQQHGAVGVLIYSDPQDDGYVKGDPWPTGPWRPETGVQRGSVQYLSKYSGDAETPGIASTLDLPDSARQPREGNEPQIVAIPLSYHDAAPILQALKGTSVPQGWQGGLPFRYHFGPGGVSVHLVSDQDYQRRIVWDVVGKIPGSQEPNSWVIAGNHHDAWVYGAVDPSSGTAAMLEAVHGVGEMLHRGWRPKRTIVFCSWDAEEQGLIGSTEWVEQHENEMQHAVAYFNIDEGVSGSDFTASAVPSLKQFIREIAHSVASPAGGTVYDQWKLVHPPQAEYHGTGYPRNAHEDVHMGDLGSGSDYTPFLQHAGVPSADVGSEGPYGVYHSAFDNYDWFVQNADPHFVYLQQMARVLGLETIRMADADVLPYDYLTYAREIGGYLDAAQHKAADAGLEHLNFASAQAAQARFLAAAQQAYIQQTFGVTDAARLNAALRQAETALLTPAGLPNRPWFRHTIYAPGEYTGYSAVVIPGVNDALDAHDGPRADQQLAVLAQALDRATSALQSAR